MSRRPTAIIITGPTASGKSALAVEVASRLHTEIVSADSRQIYRGVPIATAVPAPEELSAVTHHFVETLPLEAYYSAALYEQEALSALEGIWQESPWAVVCGGSMMYVDALCQGIDELPTISPELRSAITAQWREQGDAAMRLRLLGLDPAYYATVDLNNMKRVVHAVEISLAAGQPYSTLCNRKAIKRDFRILKFGISMSREDLFSRINRRVDAMMEAGLEQEIRAVAHLRHLNSLNTVGVKEMLAYIDGTISRDRAVESIKKNTRVYAKKQLTWLRKDPEIVWLNPSEGNIADQIIDLATHTPEK